MKIVHYILTSLLNCALILAMPSSIQGETKTLASGSWLVGSNWSPSGLPVDGDDIIITGTAELPFQNNDISLDNVTITVTSTGYLTVNKKCDLTLDENSTLIVESGGTVEGTHGNSVAIIGSSGNLLGNGTYNGPRAANENGWNSSSTTPLPVELTFFNAKMDIDHVKLNWETASETNNDYFTIERLLDNERWTIVAELQGYGTTNQRHLYEYKDFDVNVHEDAFYRLKQVDFNGKSKTFEIVMVDGKQIQNQPYRILKTNSKIEIEFKDDQYEHTEVFLINTEGRVMQKEIFDTIIEGQSVIFDLTSFPTGWYVIGISGTDNFHSEKMIHFAK